MDERKIISDLLNAIKDAQEDGSFELDPSADLGPAFGAAAEYLRMNGWTTNSIDGRWQPLR